MARSDQFGHEKNKRRDAGIRSRRQDFSVDRASVGPRDIATRARDIMRLLDIENTSTEQGIYRHSFSAGDLVGSVGGLPGAHALLGLDYEEAATFEEKNQKTAELDRKLWELKSEELEKHSPHYFLLNQLNTPIKAESLRQHMINNDGRGNFEIELTEAERAQILSKLAGKNNTKEKV